VKWIDDLDGSPLYQREDDKPETVRHRIEVYTEQTAPLIDHYRQKGLLVEVDGTQAIEAVTEDLMKAVEEDRNDLLGKVNQHQIASRAGNHARGRPD
jgi:adenylate kinase